MTDPIAFSLKSLGADHVQVAIVRRLYPSIEEYWDANWVEARVELRVGRFCATIVGNLFTTDFREFH